MTGGGRRWARVTLAVLLSVGLVGADLGGVAGAQSSDNDRGRAIELPGLEAKAPPPTLQPEVPEGDYSQPLPTTRHSTGGTVEFVPDASGKPQAHITPDPDAPHQKPVPGEENRPTGNVSDGSFDPKKSRKLDELTDERTEVFENADGSQTAALASEPIRFKDAAGEWHDYDFSLKPAKDGLAPTASDTRALCDLRLQGSFMLRVRSRKLQWQREHQKFLRQSYCMTIHPAKPSPKEQCWVRQC